MNTTHTWRDPRARLDLTPVINAAGTMTGIGASAAVEPAIDAATGILRTFVSMDELQSRASGVIAEATGAEAGCVTACAAAGLTLSVAGCMTGVDLGRIGRLPDTQGLRAEVIVQAGHLINYGASIEQTLSVSGAEVRRIGDATEVGTHELRSALCERTSAAVYVVSHHCVLHGQIPLRQFVDVCHDAGVPVIVDAASEYDLTGFLTAGADVVVYSAHKFLGGLTAGIVAGRLNLVRACYLQHQGLGRSMKVGKEGIAGAIAALDAWCGEDHDAMSSTATVIVERWLETLGRAGIRATRSPDPTGNPITRVRVHVPDDLGVRSWDIARVLTDGCPRIIVRTDGIDLGYFELDPCNLGSDEADAVSTRIEEVFESARRGRVHTTSFGEWRDAAYASSLHWPDI